MSEALNINTNLDIHTDVDYFRHWAQHEPDRIWLRDRDGDGFNEWSWKQAEVEADAVSAWLEESFGSANNVAILSKNRAHWVLANTAINLSGNVTSPMFTTQKDDVVKYLLEFTECKVLFLGESENWEKVRAILPEGIQVVTLPGVDAGMDSLAWNDLLAEYRGRKTSYQPKPDDMIAFTFTSGTTGMPKAVIQTNDSMIVPSKRLLNTVMPFRDFPRLLSYLPLSHIGERGFVLGFSLVKCGAITFNDSPANLPRDLAEVKPNAMLAVPRIWEVFSQIVLSAFGGQDALSSSLEEDPEGTIAKARGILGLEDLDLAISGSAPLSAALKNWFKELGISITEFMGMSEANGLLGNVDLDTPYGAVGKPLPGVEIRVSEEGEMIARMEGLSPGYYKQPDKTAETFVDGWLHTGDKVRVDENGYYFITGRVKDYFKTIHGKYVAPLPIEDSFSKNSLIQQQCLFGRGFSKTVMACVLSPEAEGKSSDEIAESLKATVIEINERVEKHARIGVVVVDKEPWSIDNGVLTVTLKVKRDEIDQRYGGEQAESRAKQAAEQGEIFVDFV